MSLIRNIAGLRMGVVDPALVEYGTGSPVAVNIPQAVPPLVPAPVNPINIAPVSTPSLWPDVLTLGVAVGAAWMLAKKGKKSVGKSVGKKGSGKTIILLGGGALLVYALTRPGVIPPATPAPVAAPGVTPITTPTPAPTSTAQVITAGTPLASVLAQRFLKISTIPKL